MKAVSKIIFLDENNEKFFGEGPARLLHGIEEKGSLRAAAMSMNMASAFCPSIHHPKGAGGVETDVRLS